MQLSSYIDYAVLKPTTLLANIERICAEASENKFASISVPPPFIKNAKQFLLNNNVKIGTVIGFPFGYSAIEAKIAEIILAILDGADELDVVVNIMAIKNNDWQYLANELNHIMPIIKNKNKQIKVIIETGILTEDELIKCCSIYGTADVDFISTSTGYAEKGATIEAVGLLRKHLPAHVQIKAGGEIQSPTFAKLLFAAGASRIEICDNLELWQE